MVPHKTVTEVKLMPLMSSDLAPTLALVSEAQSAKCVA